MGKRTIYAGIDIGGTKLHAVVATAKGRVIGRARKKVGSDHEFEWVMQRLLGVVQKACRKADVRLDQLAAVGIGAPSPVLPDGTAVHAPNLGWRRVPLVSRAAELLERPCFAANDCDSGTYGEYRYGAARGARTAAGLFMGTGLGGGLVFDGQLLRGDNQQAAEVGHMVVVKDGALCGCGRRGCLEAYASKTGVARRLREQIQARGQPSLLVDGDEVDLSELRSGALARAYRAGDAVARAVLDEAADYLGVGVGNLITLLGPSVIVLGGGVLEALGEELLERICRQAALVAFPESSFADTAIRLAALGDDAVALGAVAWAAHQHQAP
jgi:glucokinase